MLKIYNTMSRHLEEFQPLEPGKVKMYVCGPTVYNYIHVGNARSVVAFDVIRKYLEYRGFTVDYVSNFTDVDDKIIKVAHNESTTPQEVSERYIRAFYEDTAALSVKKATHNPKATEYISDMVVFIQDLIDKKFAYVVDGDVYFRVAKAKDYAKLANKNLAELLEGASGRLDEEAARKESAADFALWKAEKTGEISWDAPWGAGRPGWHIECSVMSTSLLGDTIDIHGGGADLEFPHHTNEIAQSEAKTGQKFANYWMHNGFVNVDGEKMSKSLGNFTTVHELLQAIEPRVLRFFLATTHYRRPVNFTEEGLQDAENNVKKLENAYRNLDASAVLTETELTELSVFQTSFKEAMDDDFNIANGLTVFYDFISWVNKGHGGMLTLEFFDQVLEILGIHFEKAERLASEIEAMIEARQVAREVRDFAKADEIRDQLKAEGIVLEDTKEGVRWHRE
ncbi:cysteine--tRNA ligase [Lactococcus taiwanensis]|jgi:cysteinyl-tRNA synthetase|uniref:cysteine--tRNA ligase n=1 Tax=Lactococcus taiwanensis TaxID=1151742 RepID=UPI0019655FFD|nr:cysteine--tRNA ligase [Lactococcus taiwanensis]QRZ11058.1 cysteine--tRNA ligase [Lactococcus taiwanensis]